MRYPLQFRKMSVGLCWLRKAIAGATLSSLVWSGGSLADAESVAKGTDAFRAGNYGVALVHFHQAAEKDPQPTLLYNIAVSYYRLGQLDEAEHRFQSLSQQTQWSGLAFYNLGLIAEARKQTADAVGFFQLCLQHSSHDKLRDLAENKLLKITATSTLTKNEAIAQHAVSDKPAQINKGAGTNTAKPWLAMTSLTFGQDSNAANLAEEVVRRRSQGQDSYLQFVAYGQTYYSGKPTEGAKLFALASVRRFDHFSALSSQTLGAGAIWERPLGQAATASGGQLLYMSMDGNPIASHIQVQWGIKQRLYDQLFGFTVYPSYFFATDDFAHIEGWRHRLDFDWQHKIDDLQFKARYRYELNDRKDRRDGDRFVSYSPTQHALLTEISWAATTDLALQAKLHYIQARYSGTNNLRGLTGVVRQARRRYTHWQYELAAKYKLTPSWIISGEFGLYTRDDNFDIYSYDGNRLTATAEYRF